MICLHCGHHNPPENRFCGMCGHGLLPAPMQPERVAEPTPPLARPAEPPRKRQATDAPLTGPSFLGLSNQESPPEPIGYSYLFQDDPEPSHKALYVLLLLLVIAGGLIYSRWQPLRQYVIADVIPRVRAQIGAASSQPQAPPAPPSVPADQATISVASTQPEQKAPEQAPGAQPSISEPEKPAPSAESEQPPDVKKADAKSSDHKEPAAAQSKAEADADSADEDTPQPAPAARRAKPQPAPGEALVKTGEKYLYGHGVRKNCSQAVSYFRAAAEQQNPHALSRLGSMYAVGECVPMDRAVAYSWFGRALSVDRNNHLLERNMSMLWREMSSEERQRAGGR